MFLRFSIAYYYFLFANYWEGVVVCFFWLCWFVFLCSLPTCYTSIVWLLFDSVFHLDIIKICMVSVIRSSYFDPPSGVRILPLVFSSVTLYLKLILAVARYLEIEWECTCRQVNLTKCALVGIFPEGFSITYVCTYMCCLDW